MPIHSRRTFLTRAALASSGLALSGVGSRAQTVAVPGHEFLFFSKPFQSLSYDALGLLAAEAGYTGLEFPVRPGGHVEPEAVVDELPKAIEAFRRHGISVPLIASGINEVSDAQQTEVVLRTAAELGVKRFRMAYYRYDLARPVREQLASFVPRLADLVALATELGIKPVYQNHSGAHYVGAPLWDIQELLLRHPPERVGLAYDIGHAVAEGSKCWPLNFHLVRDYIDVVYVKDPAWNAERKQFEWAPLGDGAIPPEFYSLLRETAFDGPMSVHVEYLDHGDLANLPQFRSAIREDLKQLRVSLR